VLSCYNESDKNIVNGGKMRIFEQVLNLLQRREVNPPAIRPGRNEECWCGSGLKYKKCHLAEDDNKAAQTCALNCGPK
jgi:uncharacterized protein YecA (UPF0149 family)